MLAKGETCKQFFSDVRGHRQPLERTPVETGHHRGGRPWREYTESLKKERLELG